MKKKKYEIPNINDTCPYDHPYEWVVCPRVNKNCFEGKAPTNCAYSQYGLKHPQAVMEIQRNSRESV